jgi:hypothetical protein
MRRFHFGRGQMTGLCMIKGLRVVHKNHLFDFTCINNACYQTNSQYFVYTNPVAHPIATAGWDKLRNQV